METSLTASPVFIQDQPDWGKPVRVKLTFKTDVVMNRQAGEQRARRRSHPRYAMQYTIAAMTIAELSLRKARSITELGAPLVVPLWPQWQTLVTMTTANRADLDVPTARLPFKVGSWAYFVQTGKVSTFRQITALGSDYIDLAASGHYPAGTLPSFTAGARVYPCILGAHNDNQFAFELIALNSTDQRVAVMEL